MRILLLGLSVLAVVGVSIGLAGGSSATEVSDPVGDTFAPVGVGALDISSIDAEFDETAMRVTVKFDPSTPIQPPSAGATNSVVGSLIFLDTDQDTGTGVNFFGFLGADFFVDIGAEEFTPGQVEVVDEAFTTLGTAPISFTAASFVVGVPLSLIGEDDGLLDYFVLIGAPDVTPGYFTFVDEAPNEGAATSEAAPTPTHTPTPMPTPTPTPTPAVAEAVQLPATGGEPSGGSGLGRVALVMGALLVASGGLVLMQRRRA